MLSNCQSREEFSVSRALYQEGLHTSDLARKTDILHLHGSLLLNSPEILSLIRQRTEENQPVVVSLYREPQLGSKHEEPALNPEVLALLERCNAVFLQDGNLGHNFEQLGNCCWARQAITQPAHDRICREPAPGNLTLLYFEEERRSDNVEFIRNTLAKLQDEGLCYNLQIEDYSKTAEESWLSECLSKTHIFLENLALPGPGFTSLLALSMGKTVLANIAETNERARKQFELSPILRTNRDNLHYRLQSLARQPKSLRDFGNRGMEFIRLNHNPRDLADSYMDLYCQFIPTR